MSPYDSNEIIHHFLLVFATEILERLVSAQLIYRGGAHECNMSQNYENMILENLDRVTQPIIRFEIIQNLNLENLRLDLHHYEILHR